MAQGCGKGVRKWGYWMVSKVEDGTIKVAILSQIEDRYTREIPSTSSEQALARLKKTQGLGMEKS